MILSNTRSKILSNTRSNRSLSRHTQFLLLGVGAGLIVFVLQLGLRSLVFITGGAIAIITILYWFWQNRAVPTAQAPSANLLQAEVFQDHLTCFQQQVPAAEFTTWLPLQEQAMRVQAIATHIAQREPMIVSELLETLHSVLDLVEQISAALVLRQQIQTPQYLTLTEQRLQGSLTRIQATEVQLQILNDEIAWKRNASVVSEKLQLLSAENEQFCTNPVN
ncbi:MAG: hypothetical protein MUF49_12175 [Oculatellaceae cyanobacterium Prado106]|nr:hypothetical protein [Oculatellaceae cyanobacterium Prado106]